MDFERLRTQLVAFCKETLRGNFTIGAEDIAHDVIADYLTSDIAEDRALAWCFKQCWSRMGNLTKRLNRFPRNTLITDSSTNPTGFGVNEPTVTDQPIDDIQIHDRLEELLRELPVSSEVLMRLSLLGLNAIQIAGVLGKPKNTVQSSLTRAREALGLPIIDVHTSISTRLRELLTDAQAIQVHCLLSHAEWSRVA